MFIHKNFTVIPQLCLTSGETKCSPTAILCNHGDPRAKGRSNIWKTQFLASKISWEPVLVETVNKVVAELVSISLVIFFPGNKQHLFWKNLGIKGTLDNFNLIPQIVFKKVFKPVEVYSHILTACSILLATSTYLRRYINFSFGSHF